MSERKLRTDGTDLTGEADTGSPHPTELPTTGVSQALDRLNIGLGAAASWLWLVVVVVIVGGVIARYFFDLGSVSVEELTWHISSFIWLLGIAYTMVYDQHVRVDVIHERLGLRSRAWIELFGLLLLLLPFLAIVLYYTVPYAYQSLLIDETSQAPSGLPHRWVLKAMIALAIALSIVAAIARLFRCTATLFGWPVPRPAGRLD